MAKCKLCGKKSLFLRVDDDGLCDTCSGKQKADALSSYKSLAAAYSRIKPFRKFIDSSNIEGMEECIDACQEFERLMQNMEITPAISRLIKSNAVARYSNCELPDFDTETKYGDKLEDITKTLDDLLHTATFRKNLLMEAHDEAVHFVDTLNSLPIVDISVSETAAKKRSVAEVNDIPFSTITKKTPRDKLGNFVVIDTETTGLNASQSEIIEISAIRFRDYKPVEAFTTLCAPKKGISAEAARINGITAEMVAGKPTFDKVASALLDFIGADNLVGHNLEFDLKFIVKHGVDLTASKRKYYDTLAIAQKTLKKLKEKWDREYDCYMPDYSADYDVEDYKLGTLCRYYGIQLSGAHRALADCYATGLLLECLAKDRE